MDHRNVFFEGVTKRAVARPMPCVRTSRTAASTAPVDEFFRFLFARAGLPVESYRPGPLARRMPACLRFLRVTSAEDAMARLREKPALQEPLLSIALLGVTEFCRDRPVFDSIRNRVLPRMRALNRPVRVWSAACSDGRELLSVAAMLDDAGIPAGTLLGTDYREDALRAARRGEFVVDESATLEPWLQSRFTRNGDTIRVSDPLRDAPEWKRADILAGTEPGPWDMILWRNMAIYLQAHAADKIWHALIAELAPGGVLVTGKADYPARSPTLEKAGPCLFFKHPDS